MVGDTISETDAQAERDARTEWCQLHSFARDLLAAITALGDAPKGTAIRDYVSSEYGEQINDGRLYPALDGLAEKGLIDKSPQAGLANAYALTAWGERVLEAGRDRLVEVTGGDR
jgi:DNA-binding PadR family transcriptional regulator